MGFSLGSLPPADGSRAVAIARFQCVECGAAEDIRLPGDSRLNPTLLATRMTRKGWKAHPSKKQNTYCPSCAGPKPRPAPEPEPEPEPEKVSHMPAPVIVREITPEQRFQIRSLLDKHFDDKAGGYLDGMTDARIAEAVDVPRIRVEQLRETAYGPIRVDPRAAELQRDLAKLRGDLDAAEAELAAKLDRMQADIQAAADARMARLAELRDRFNELENRAAIVLTHAA